MTSELHSCGTCKYNCCERNLHEVRFYCGNENSDMGGCHTEYDDTCEEWEEK